MSSKHKQSKTFLRLALIILALTVFAVIFYQQNKDGIDSSLTTSEIAETEPAELEENKGQKNLVADTNKESSIEDKSEKDVQKDVVIEVSPTPPFVETIRVEPDGSVVLAGRSDPNAEIKILLDEAVINYVQADASGNFVALFDIGNSTEIRVMSLLAIVDSVEVYAEEDIIISASKSTTTILTNEKVVAQVETYVGDQKTESQEAETSSEEKSLTKTIVETETAEVAEFLDKISGTQAEQKRELAESEKDIGDQTTESQEAKISSEEKSLTKIIVETETAEVAEFLDKISGTQVEQKRELAESEKDIGDQTTESQEAETSSRERSLTKAIVQSETEEVAEVSDKTSGTQAEQKRELAESEADIGDQTMESQEAESSSEEKSPTKTIVGTETEEVAEVVDKTSGTQAEQKRELSDSETDVGDQTTARQEAEAQSEEKLPTKTIVTTETEEVSEFSDKKSGTQAEQKRELAVSKTNTAASSESESLESTSVKSTSQEAETKQSVAQIDDAVPSSANIITKETETVGKVSTKVDKTDITEQAKVVTSTKKEAHGETSRQQDQTSSVTADYDTPVAGASVLDADKNDVSDMPVAETIMAQTETEPKSIVKEKLAENEALSVKKTIEDDAEQEMVEQEPLVVIAGKDGVRVVQSSKKGTTQDVSVDAISYDESGDVALTGRGNPSQMVRVYLDNLPVSTAAMDASGQWSTALSEIDAGIYTLRVDELDSTGNVVSRLETPFKREKREDLAAYMIRVDEPARINVVTVQPGNTLWAIARERYGRGILYVRVFEENKDKIRDPDLIYPGQVFSLPDD